MSNRLGRVRTDHCCALTGSKRPAQIGQLGCPKRRGHRAYWRARSSPLYWDPSGRGSAWLERCVRDAEVEGSNPFAPTLTTQGLTTIFVSPFFVSRLRSDTNLTRHWAYVALVSLGLTRPSAYDSADVKERNRSNAQPRTQSRFESISPPFSLCRTGVQAFAKNVRPNGSRGRPCTSHRNDVTRGARRA